MKPALLVLIIVATALASSFATCLVMFAVLDRPNVVIVHAVAAAPAPTGYAASAPALQAADDAADAPPAPAPVAAPVVQQAPAAPVTVAAGKPDSGATGQAPDNTTAIPPVDAPVIAQNPAQIPDNAGQGMAQNPVDGGQTVAQNPDPGAAQIGAGGTSTLPPAADTVYVPVAPPVVQQVLVPVPVNVSTTSINLGIVGNPGNFDNSGNPVHHPVSSYPTPVPATYAAPVTTSSNPQANGIFRQPSPHPTVTPIHPPVGPLHN